MVRYVAEKIVLVFLVAIVFGVSVLSTHGCAPESHNLDLTGCYSATVTVQISLAPGQEDVNPGWTYCAGTDGHKVSYDSFEGKTHPGEWRIDEVREVAFDEHVTTIQHFTGTATAEKADITDDVQTYKDGVPQEPWSQTFSYRDIVRTGNNP